MAKRRTTAKLAKGAVVRFRVSNQEKAALIEAARLEGLEFSQWARQRLLRAAGVLPPPK
jgi:hypothetical protein